jgi:hypothetical protein
MALTPVLIVVALLGLAILALRKLAVFARSEIERLQNLEKQADAFFRNITPVINAEETSIELLTIAKEIGEVIDSPDAARDICRIHTGKLVLPENPYGKVFEEFRYSRPDLSGYLDAALQAARLAFTYASREWGPKARECLDEVREQARRGTNKGIKEDEQIAVAKDVLGVIWDLAKT